MKLHARIAALSIVFASFLHSADVPAEEMVADYQEIHEGNLPIILESGHGGSKDIPSIRPIPNLGGIDNFTLELTRLIRDQAERILERLL